MRADAARAAAAGVKRQRHDERGAPPHEALRFAVAEDYYGGEGLALPCADDDVAALCAEPAAHPSTPQPALPRRTSAPY